MKTTFKTIAAVVFVALSLTSCGPSEREILSKENDKTMVELDDMTFEHKMASQEAISAINMFILTGEKSDSLEMVEATDKVDAIEVKLDSLHKVVDDQLSRLGKLPK